MRVNIIFLLNMVVTTTLLVGCSGGSNDSGSNSGTNISSISNAPNPYVNGYRVTRETTTLSGRPFSVTDYIYNQEDNTVTLNRLTGEDASSKIHKLDESGRIVESITPAASNLLSDSDRVWGYVYNTEGQLISRNDRSGFIDIEYRRNPEGNIIARDELIPVEFVYDSEGQLLSSVDSIETEPFTYLYDANNRLIGGESPGDDGGIRESFGILYDENGNVSQVTAFGLGGLPIFSDTYEYEVTTTNVVNHTLMRILNELPDLTNTPF